MLHNDGVESEQRVADLALLIGGQFNDAPKLRKQAFVLPYEYRRAAPSAMSGVR